MLAPSTAVTGPQNFQSIVKPLAVRPKLVFCLISRGVLVFPHRVPGVASARTAQDGNVGNGGRGCRRGRGPRMARPSRAPLAHRGRTEKQAGCCQELNANLGALLRMHGWRPGPADKREDPDYTRLKRALRRVEAALRLVRGVHDDGAGRQAALRDFALQSQRTASSARVGRGGTGARRRVQGASRVPLSPLRLRGTHPAPPQQPAPQSCGGAQRGRSRCRSRRRRGGCRQRSRERTEATEEETEATGAKEAVGAVEDAVEEAQDARDQLVMIAGVQVPAARQADAAEAAGGSKAEDGCEPRDAETAEDSEMGELARWARSEEAKEEEEWRGQRQQHRIEEDMQAARPRLQQRSHAHRHGGAMRG